MRWFVLADFPPKKMNRNLFPDHYTSKNTPENKLTQNDTHNPRFTVWEGAVCKEPQVLCVHTAESDSARRVCVVDTGKKILKKRKEKKRHFQDDGASPCQPLSRSFLTALLSCACLENKQAVVCCPCLFLFFSVLAVIHPSRSFLFWSALQTM